tara:strand:- start:1317 stop:2339 length:1023 start_codon:yes stop_codon:yes gene_type:complete
MKNPNNFQRLFFNMVRERVSDHEILVDVITDLLHCSRDSAYRRIRGTTDLSLNDTVVIARHFSIPLNHLIGQSDQSVVFQKGSFIRSLDDFRTYLQNSLVQLHSIKNYKSHQLIYQAKDIPIYYQFRYPRLSAFKMFVWLKSIYGVDRLDSFQYEVNMIPKDLLKLGEDLWEAYSKINSVEIWNDTTILSLLNQLEYYYEAGLLNSKEEAIAICDEYQDMMKLIYRQALRGKKAHHNNAEEFSAAEYKMYYHEILIMDNHILAELDQNKKLYFVPYAGLNYLNTNDPLLTESMSQYLNGQKEKSSLISNISEKERNKFFIRIKTRIDQLKSKIEMTNPFM